MQYRGNLSSEANALEFFESLKLCLCELVMVVCELHKKMTLSTLSKQLSMRRGLNYRERHKKKNVVTNCACSVCLCFQMQESESRKSHTSHMTLLLCFKTKANYIVAVNVVLRFYIEWVLPNIWHRAIIDLYCSTQIMSYHIAMYCSRYLTFQHNNVVMS